jgi:hypothetical protein
MRDPVDEIVDAGVVIVQLWSPDGSSHPASWTAKALREILAMCPRLEVHASGWWTS